jgi:1-acyl-sn-glycerol-3-phosphate acyltransferase
MVFLRSLVFLLFQTLLTIPFGGLAWIMLPLSPVTRYRVITLWAKYVVWAMRVILGIRHRVIGLENLPSGPAVVLSKHQSAWETIAFQRIFPPMSFVLKKSLLHIPFFGWGLRMFSPIAIDRGAGREALKQVETIGKERMAQGFWVLVFPEGTRTPYGQVGNYQIGGPFLAVKAGVPVVPVAHNAGKLWPRRAFMKQPGEITVVIGPPIPTAGRKASDVLAETKAWIEGQMQSL